MASASGKQSNPPPTGLWKKISPPASTRLILRVFIALLAAFALTRILFYALYANLAVNISILQVILSFLVGLRFDIATAALIWSPWILLMHLPLSAEMGGCLCRILMPCLIVAAVVASLIAIADCVYYAHAAKRFSYEPLLIFRMGGKLLEFAFGEHPVLMPLLVAGVFLYWGIIWNWTRRKLASTDQRIRFTRVGITLWGLLLLGFCIIGVRGGLQNYPLRISDAYFSNDTVINHASLNPVYTFVRSLNEDRTIYALIPPESALKTVRAAVVEPGERFRDDRYPLARNSTGKKPASPYNVVLIMMESLTAEFMGTYGDNKKGTPNLDRIASQGIVFERFLSSGSRSSHGIFATLFSVPAQLGSPVMHTTGILNNYRSLAQILRDHGYETLFIYGGVYEFTNALGVLMNGGFDRVIGEPLPANPPIRRKTWGYDDEDMFARLHHELSIPGDKPRFAVLFTQNLHGREVPEDFLKQVGGMKYGNETRYDVYYNLQHYTDWCLGQFMSTASSQPYFNNTIFVITADHTSHINPNLYENYHIPFLLYAPALLSPARCDAVGSQPDILPTILGLLNLETEHASFGRDLMRVASRNESGFAYLMLGDSIGWIEGPWLMHDPLGETAPRLYNYIENPEMTNNFTTHRSELAQRFRHRARSFMQVSRQLLVENRIYPPGFVSTQGNRD
ncbi:MAG: sulfatase-like hydrolase/transferase [Deltaproteobacteria bacterium]|jgi:phosphoglycerol transferase MdoB-like AlkP superfamily enzyme|nr:sulfatase-like hydrolase/transferase [Deltaproteobacteria bacterium]